MEGHCLHTLGSRRGMFPKPDVVGSIPTGRGRKLKVNMLIHWTLILFCIYFNLSDTLKLIGELIQFQRKAYFKFFLMSYVKNDLFIEN